MGKRSDIGWLHRRLPDGLIVEGHTFNSWWGCVRRSPGCENCYAETIAKHYGHHVWGPHQTTPRRFFGEKHWQEPRRWNRDAQKNGHRESVFCSSMADVFEDNPLLVEERKKLWPLIEQTPWLNWLLLTKRPENMHTMVPDSWKGGWPDNAWAMASAETQGWFERRIEDLLAVPAIVHGLSLEPLIGAIDLGPYQFDPRLSWVIVGGESGPDADRRPLHPAWERRIRLQCQQGGIAYYFKQWAGRTHKSGGNLVEGRIYDDMPPEFPTWVGRSMAHAGN